MRVLCAPDSFKGTLKAVEVSEAMRRGAIRAGGPFVDVDTCPIADGGEGTLNALMPALNGQILSRPVVGPRGETVTARYGVAPELRTGVVELAEASGLLLVPPSKQDPTRTTTYGTGQLIAAARDAGCEKVIVCIGGSATNDGGAGLAQALGGAFYDSAHRLIEEPLTGGLLERIARVDPPTRLPQILVACDVDNPLCGPEGAAATYGPQKGATPRQVELLDRALAHLASITGGDINTPGYGAAGGAGYGLAVMCGAMLRPGIEIVLDAVRFEERCAAADLVLTGEGRLDAQSIRGKACLGVAAAAGRLGIETFAIIGRTAPGSAEFFCSGSDGPFGDCLSLTDRFGEERALNEPVPLISELAEEIVRNWLALHR
ncbi:MAG: glycerate kinase [Phycisphaerales bacterium]|nr:MAG: glycerate kinase [Phycisphaerales bacterium]